MGCSERRKEIRRRRHRRKKLTHLKRRAEKATQSEKNVIAGKIRGLTSGSATLIQKLGLEDR